LFSLAGIADTNASMAHMKQLIERKLPGVYVRALEITTYDSSIFTGIDIQVSHMRTLTLFLCRSV
jgi:hypothetical protein